MIQEEVFDDRIMFEKLVEFAKQEPTAGISPTLVSNQFQISLLVAKEQLLLAEKSGYLCRDDTLNGIFYFQNLFPTFRLL